jgi:hypothetical protein
MHNTAVPDWSPCLSGNPGININSCSVIGDMSAVAQGSVTGICPGDYKVAVYIKVRGGWWTKPYWSSPLTPISANGNWACDIVTGGVDQEATQVRAYLVPNSYSPPSMGGHASLPVELEQNSLGYSDCFR